MSSGRSRWAGATKSVRLLPIWCGLATFVAVLSLSPGCSRTDARIDHEPVATNASTTGEEASTVELPYRVGMAMVSGDVLYATVEQGSSGVIDTIMRFDAGPKSGEPLVTSSEDIVSFRCDGGWLVWETCRKLYARSFETGEQRLLASNRDFYAPALTGNTVVWIEYLGQGRAELVSLDLKTGRRRRLSPIVLPGLYNNFVEIQDGKVIWTDIIDEVGHYRLFDLTSGHMADYELEGTDFRFPGYAMLSGDRIYSINFKDHQEWDWTVQQFGYFSTVERRWVPLVDTGYINHFRAGGGRVMVVDQNQQLTWRRTSGSDEAMHPTASPGRFDWIQMSGDSTVIAGREGQDSRSTTLLIFRPEET